MFYAVATYPNGGVKDMVRLESRTVWAAKWQASRLGYDVIQWHPADGRCLTWVRDGVIRPVWRVMDITELYPTAGSWVTEKSKARQEARRCRRDPLQPTYAEYMAISAEWDPKPLTESS